MSYVNANYQLIIDAGFRFWISWPDADEGISIYCKAKKQLEHTYRSMTFPPRYKLFRNKFYQKMREIHELNLSKGNPFGCGYDFSIRYVAKARKARAGSPIDQDMRDLINGNEYLKNLRAARKEASEISASLPQQPAHTNTTTQRGRL